MIKFLIGFLIFIFISTSSSATTGCIDASKALIYTSYQSGQNYYRSSVSTPSSPGCLFASTGGICSIGGPGANNGLLGDTNLEECPIDDYAWLILLLFGGLGFVHLRKKNLILN